MSSARDRPGTEAPIPKAWKPLESVLNEAIAFPTMGSRVAITPLADIDLRKLAEVSAGHDCFLSIYLPTASRVDMQANASFLETRVEAIQRFLPAEMEGQFLETWESLGEGLLKEAVPGERGRVVFVSACEDFLETYRLPVAPGRVMVLDNSPYILPLTRLMDDHEDYGIVLLDSQEAAFYLVRSTRMEEVATASIDLMNRHRKGGMSQKRFNRLRRGQIDEFIDKVIEDLDRLEEMKGVRGLVIAGPGEVKTLLLDALPPRYARLLLGTVDIDMDVRHAELQAHADALARADEVSDEEAAVEALRRAIFKDGLAAVGLQETRSALARGRVATLLLEDGLSLRGWSCETCRAFADGPGKCPRCGGRLSGSDLVNEMVEMAQLSDADVQHVKASPFLGSIGGVAAVLRY